ncbi:MAG: hypothetical protein GX613_16275 [Chloroflexi bacterium]|nr:hypothetical protein [Chloroflexota bacterium]
MTIRQAVAAARGPRALSQIALVGLTVILVTLAFGLPESYAQSPSDTGYIGPSHGGLSAPTGEKPESKLWFVGGHWWADLVNPEVQRHHIYRFDPDTFEWIDTGIAIDPRASARADVLWDDESERLYVVSHIFTTNAAPTSAESNWGYLYRFRYDPSILRFLPDDGFPVPVTRGKSETLTIAKDSTGRLWVAFVENRQVMFNHSDGDDLSWGEPQPLPVPNGGALSVDDIAAIVSFGEDRVGIAWSDQRMSTMYFAVHEDGTPPDAWQEEVIIAELDVVDDHINLKADSEGRVYLASKTSEKRERPLAVLYVRDADGAWSMHPFGTGRDGHTRPIVLLDEDQQRLHMFAAAPESGGVIYHKQSRLDRIAFAPGSGDIVLQNLVDGRINNVTSTKQSVNETSGILILASGSTNRYFFNHFPLSGEPEEPPMPEAAPNWPLSGTEMPSPLAPGLP